MPELHIVTDLRKGEPLFDKARVIEADLIAVGRMPHGMQTGNSSVSAIIKFREPLFTKDGREVNHGWCETSLFLFTAASGAFLAAEEVAKHAGGN